MRHLWHVALGLTLVTPMQAQQVGVESYQIANATHEKPRSFRLVIAPDVFDKLGALADTMRHETVRCLIGSVRGDSAVVDLAWQPAISLSTPNEVRYESCPGATLALWHNHVWTVESAAQDACYLSRTDIDQALRIGSPPVQIVQVNSAVSCWWTRRQINRRDEVSVLWPPPAQERHTQHRRPRPLPASKESDETNGATS